MTSLTATPRYFEFPIKWSHIKRGFAYGTNKGFIPTLRELLTTGRAVDVNETCDHSVCLTPKPEDVEDLRQWCKENSDEYHIMGRFGTLSYEESLSSGFCKDVKFIFKDQDIAVMFKLTFG